MMRMLGGWIALTPELAAKLLFGRHVWDCAQHADAWGRRLPELRSPAQQSEPANSGVVRLMDRLESADAPGQTAERLVGVYRVLKPHLVTVYARHLAATNPVYEPPTRRILTRCLDEERRHVAAGASVIAAMLREAEAVARARDWERAVTGLLGEAGGVTGDVTAPMIDAAEPGVEAAAVAQDLVKTPPPFDPAVIPEDLAAVVDAHRRALETGDVLAAAAHADTATRDTVLAPYSALRGPFTASRVIALARVGRYRMVKVRLEGPRSVAVVQQRWTPSQSGWRVSGVEVVRSEPASPSLA
ncbi:MAG TPA: hypothetical protein VMR23_16165 [Candidatus Limnocylindria bacterium]|nr:hypothetical protein [Candidatus Limnocylindria bacterium]